MTITVIISSLQDTKKGLCARTAKGSVLKMVIFELFTFEERGEKRIVRIFRVSFLVGMVAWCLFIDNYVFSDSRIDTTDPQSSQNYHVVATEIARSFYFIFKRFLALNMRFVTSSLSVLLDFSLYAVMAVWTALRCPVCSNYRNHFYCLYHCVLSMVLSVLVMLEGEGENET